MRTFPALIIAVAVCGCVSAAGSFGHRHAIVDDATNNPPFVSGYCVVAVDGKPVKRCRDPFVTVIPLVDLEPGTHKLTLRLADRFSISDAPTLTAEGFRLIWYHSTRKAELDAAARATSIRRSLLELSALRAKLQSPRTRYRDPAKIQAAVDNILNDYGVSQLVRVTLQDMPQETYRQDHRGRPGPNTRYIKDIQPRFDLQYDIDHAQMSDAERGDGVFPLVTNDRTLSGLDLLQAYKRQPLIEKRFEQMKTDFAIAPVWLKNAKRVNALLGVYYLALLAEALLERELRMGMEREGLESLPMYPEGRDCSHPTARRLIDIFDSVQRHEIHQSGETSTVTVTELTPLQRRLLRLLRIPRPIMVGERPAEIPRNCPAHVRKIGDRSVQRHDNVDPKAPECRLQMHLGQLHRQYPLSFML